MFSGCKNGGWVFPKARRHRLLGNPQFNYEPFNSNSVNIRFWSWNYRGCWHQTCPPIDTRCWMGLNIPHCKFPNARVGIWKTYFFSLPHQLFWHWAIYAPAALRRSGSHFSGSLSGIEPLFPVTRWNHGRPLSYHRKLIGQIFEWSIAGTRPCDSRSYYESPRERRAALVFYLINTPLPEVGAWLHVLALELPQLSM